MEEIIKEAEIEAGGTISQYDKAMLKDTVIALLVICLIFVLAGGAIAVLTLNKLDKATNKSSILPYAILTLIFSNLIAGILILCMKDTDFYKTTSTNPALKTTNSNTYGFAEQITSELNKIEELRKSGVINEEEYQNLRRKIIEKA